MAHVLCTSSLNRNTNISVKEMFLHQLKVSLNQMYCCILHILILFLSQDKVLSNKTPKLDRSDGVKEMKEKAPKRKLPFTTGANGDQKDSDSGRTILENNLSIQVGFDVEKKEEFGVTISHPLMLSGNGGVYKSGLGFVKLVLPPASN